MTSANVEALITLDDDEIDIEKAYSILKETNNRSGHISEYDFANKSEKQGMVLLDRHISIHRIPIRTLNISKLKKHLNSRILPIEYMRTIPSKLYDMDHFGELRELYVQSIGHGKFREITSGIILPSFKRHIKLNNTEIEPILLFVEPFKLKEPLQDHCYGQNRIDQYIEKWDPKTNSFLQVYKELKEQVEKALLDATQHQENPREYIYSLSKNIRKN